ncbi:hypothetical protein G4H71_00430 [Rhodococcus triatomae]|uniref:PH domain-containing protein n=1 Tax=Rhodococcus triatomae TaxID=300028 RepID=A0A1G8CPP2_9NOCA|nr:hypothetical protein [Rhodococcus triatomae]QNG18600.1 hypothetical protein G4H72_07620 [Rhodococcus triatomae]QNG21731.1 hypothetical protein G4H71_00430 [Rhodococcus triatomae]SDH47497.1 hypothetical protein SAMN05444695_10287 [Rhodococcus triatomae]
MTSRERARFALIFLIGVAFVAICTLGFIAGIIEDEPGLAKYAGLLTIYWAIHYIFLFRHRASYNGKLELEDGDLGGAPTSVIRYAPSLKFGYMLYGSVLALACGFAAYDLSPLQGHDTWLWSAIFGALALWLASLPGAYLIGTLHRGYLAFTPEGIEIQSWTRKATIPWDSILDISGGYTKKSHKEFGYPETVITVRAENVQQKYSTLIWRMNERIPRGTAVRIDYRKINSDARLVHDYVLTQAERRSNFRRQPVV